MNNHSFCSDLNSQSQDDPSCQTNGSPQQRRKNQKRPRTQGTKIGHWSTKQQRKYHLFLERFFERFTIKKSKGQIPVFKSMSKFICTRGVDQCRSHHQRVQRKHPSFEDILYDLRYKFYNCCNPQALLNDLKVLEPDAGFQILDLSHKKPNEDMFSLEQAETQKQCLFSFETLNPSTFQIPQQFNLDPQSHNLLPLCRQHGLEEHIHPWAF